MSRVLINYYDKEKDSLNTYDLNMKLDPEAISKVMIPTTQLTLNDRYSSYSIEGTPEVKGIMYKTEHPDLRTLTNKNMRIVTESYSTHLAKLKNLRESNYKWIYNIIDNNAEPERIIHQTSEYVLMKDYVWDESMNNIEELHILAIVRDKRLMSIREITQADIEMLLRIKGESILKIQEKFNISEEKLKIFFHYVPSTYLLHIHFVHVEKCNYKTSIEKCISFDSAIKNISMDPDYYHGDMKILSYY